MPFHNLSTLSQNKAGGKWERALHLKKDAMKNTA